MNLPVNLYDTAAARWIDEQASALLDGDRYVLMQRAGAAAWQLLQQHWPAARRITVLCGTGNNGGDGYVLAGLALAAGRQVRVVHLPGQGPRTELAQRACRDYLAQGGQIELFPCALDQAEVLVDGLFGIGLNRPPDDAMAVLIAAINAAPAAVLALDVPSGVDAEHGSVPGAAVRAALTLQFIVPHHGLYTGDALEYVGERLLAELDVPSALITAQPAAAQSWSPALLAGYVRPRRRNTHKGESGRVLCIGGNDGSGGAVMLAAEAALRSGAGLLQVATRTAHIAPLLARCPEAMVRAVDGAQALQPMLQAAGVVAIGPGLGQDSWSQELWLAALLAQRPLVIDADGLNLLAIAPRPLVAAILTPHPGEAARLLGNTSFQVQRDRLSAAAALAERFAAVVVLKGAGSVVAAPGQVPRIIAAGNPGMAVGGMGDLLTGVIAALLAQGYAPFDAATLGALLHAAAGDAAAMDGERGLLPSDLLPWLRRLVNPVSSV
jgi:hydroxyethylthiazole kinase-like uncharacterized protein yjeF